MSSLNILCAICNEFFNSNDNVYATTNCGHLFHQQCLFRWLTRSNTCPQCRATCHRRRVHRVFLNFSEPPEVDEIEEMKVNAPSWIFIDDSTGPPTGAASTNRLAGALKIGTDAEGNDTYVARVYLYEDLLPAYYVPNKGGVYAAWNCKSHFLTDEIEILDVANDTAEYKWVPAANGDVPPNAIITGYAETGENLYTGRGQHGGNILAGKVHPSHHVLYMPYQELEVNTKEYEVLVRIPKDAEQSDH